MKIRFLVAVVFSFVATSALNVVGQTTVLDNATFFSAPFRVNDAVYDRTRDVVFATTPSSQGDTLGNRLLEINPSDGTVLNSTVVGSEPNKLAISSDGSRIYIGIDGDPGVRLYTPDTGTLGAIAPLSDSDGPAVAEDIAVSPGFPDSVVVSRGDGILEVFNVAGTMLTSTFSQPLTGFGTNDNLVSFVNTNTLFTYNNSNSGSEGMLYDFDGQTLTLDISQNRVVTGANIEVETGSDGQIYFTNGLVLDSSDLLAEGTFNTGLEGRSAVVEPVPALGLTYFAGPATSQTGIVTLSVFDSETFLLIDSVEVSGIRTGDAGGELIAAGENRLVLITQERFFGFDSPRVMTFISDIPVSMPILGDVNQDGVVDFSDIPAFISVLQMGQFQAEADINQDGEVNFADVPAFIEILVAA